jgi:hypothetical protein
MADRTGGSMSIEAVEWLRDRRGHEQVSFDDVADHLEDFVRVRPETRETIAALATFLARVEDLSHEHQGHGPTLGVEEDEATVPGSKRSEDLGVAG